MVKKAVRTSLRDYLASHYHPIKNDPEQEQLDACIREYFSSYGLTLTRDDANAIKEYGLYPVDYFGFSAADEIRIDEVYAAVYEFIDFMITRPEYDNTPVPPVRTAEVGQIADLVADALSKMGYDVYFPTHVEIGDEAGTEYISDYYVRREPQ